MDFKTFILNSANTLNSSVHSGTWVNEDAISAKGFIYSFCMDMKRAGFPIFYSEEVSKRMAIVLNDFIISGHWTKNNLSAINFLLMLNYSMNYGESEAHRRI